MSRLNVPIPATATPQAGPARLLRLLAAGAAGLLLWGGLAQAQAIVRPIPDDAERGHVRHVHQNLVTIDGEPRLLAPGAIIRNTNNLIIVPASLPPEGAVADYTVNAEGQIFRVWLLTPEEQARERKPKSEP